MHACNWVKNTPAQLFSTSIELAAHQNLFCCECLSQLNSLAPSTILKTQGRQSKYESGEAQSYSYDGYRNTPTAAKGSLI